MPWHVAGPWWLWPTLMCLVLTGIHGYLGIHVLQRKVIFVDLAMAQIAALGAAYALLLGYEPHEDGDRWAIYGFSLAFTLVGAAVISLARMRHERVPHEAFIGIVYASASALAILVLSKTPGEGDAIRHMLVGNILASNGRWVLGTAAVYAAVGAFHWIFRRRFFEISRDADAAEKKGVNVRLWDFFFYVSFGVVITSSVSIAGVLLVFSYLVVPGVIAVMFADGTRVRVAIAWVVGAAVSFGGMILGYVAEFPPGPAVVACFAGGLVISGAVHFVRSAARPLRELARLGAGASAVALLLWGSTLLRKAPEEHGPEIHDILTRSILLLDSASEADQLDGLHHLEELKDPHAVPAILDLLKRTESDRVLEHAAHALVELKAGNASADIVAAADRTGLDGFLRLALARSALELEDPDGLRVLIDLLGSEEVALVKDEAKGLFETLTGVRADVQPLADPEVNRPAVAKLREWWGRRGRTLKWRGQTGRFE